MKKLLLFIGLFPIVLSAQDITVSSNVTLIVGTGNVVSVSTPNGLILIDTGDKATSEKITKRFTNAAYLISTHRHADHTAGNDFYGSAGAQIIAHSNTARYLRETNSGVTAVGYPKILVGSNYTLSFGGQRMELIYFPNAHTDGDLAVYFPDLNYIHLADISFDNMYNFIDTRYGGTIDGLIASTEKIVAMINNRTKVSPGHGKLLTRKDLQRNLAMYKDIRSKVKDMKDKGMTLEQVKAAKPSAAYDKTASWGFINGDKFVESVFNSL
ncbi:MAG: MBL fold metallo-hydrolase [Brevinema sp.]